jgi:polyisoprenoid-binding protein YceI
MKKLLFIFLSMGSLLFSQVTAPKSGCILSQEGDVKVSWKAFKTPSKIGVGGVFKSVVYKSIASEGKNFKEILVGSSVEIDTKSVDSKNKDRDLKLVNSFFSLMKDEKIIAKIVDMTSNKRVKKEPRTGILSVEISMNGVTKSVPLSYVYNNGVMKATGYIDILDFGAAKSLIAINKACFDLHKGKTWNDVEIGVELKIKAILCAAPHK